MNICLIILRTRWRFPSKEYIPLFLPSPLHYTIIIGNIQVHTNFKSSLTNFLWKESPRFSINFPHFLHCRETQHWLTDSERNLLQFSSDKLTGMAYYDCNQCQNFNKRIFVKREMEKFANVLLRMDHLLFFQ